MKCNKLLWTFFVVVAALSACRKDGSPPPSHPVTDSTQTTKSDSTATPPVTVSTINPNAGVFSTVVTVTGINFSADTTKDTVWFNNVRAVVQQASATQLTVVVPKSAGTGVVAVKVGASKGNGPVFSYDYTVMVSTLAGNGTKGNVNGSGSVTEFNLPAGLCIYPTGSVLYVCDVGNNQVKALGTGIANGTRNQYLPPAGTTNDYAGYVSGFVNGTTEDAEFSSPTSVAADASGNLYVADNLNNAIRLITTAGNVTTFAGGTSGFADGTGTAAQFSHPWGVATDASGNVYVSDAGNQRIRKITPAGTVTTLAGTNAPGFADGTGSAAMFYNPAQLAVDSNGNVYVADIANNGIRKITPAGVVTTVAGTGVHGYADGPAGSAQFYFPAGVAVDNKGNIYVADTYNNTIRMINSSGVVTTLAGNAKVFGGYKDGDASVALFNRPTAIAVGPNGMLYVSDNQNNVIRVITYE